MTLVLEIAHQVFQIARVLAVHAAKVFIWWVARLRDFIAQEQGVTVFLHYAVGAQARLMSQALRKIAGNASKYNCTVIFLNQLRHKVCARPPPCMLALKLSRKII